MGGDQLAKTLALSNEGWIIASITGFMAGATIIFTIPVGRAIWRKWSGYHRRSRVETKMHCVKLLDQNLMARDFDRQGAELQARTAVLNGYTPRGIRVTVAVG
ncbi:hypothetical protein CUV01_06460 [Paracoccus tegillarcae]|uniref:Uncharacterized protein n=1 Tax=Paracoccus tegillarcae TaxID=1529068 RepID=A0A2K9EFF7_9RHOB|nr:hypothetical protein CUV01_06460 [Paracoccus tegillarcae]